MINSAARTLVVEASDPTRPWSDTTVLSGDLATGSAS
jgi:hypothetical protein